MKTNFRFLILFACFFSFVIITQAQIVKLKQIQENGIYKKGDKIRVVAILEKNTRDSLFVKVLENNNKLISKTTFIPANDSMVIYEGSFNEPCSVMVEARIKGKKQTIGMMVEPELIKPGSKTPEILKPTGKNARFNHSSP